MPPRLTHNLNISLIPFFIIIAFATKGISLYMAKVLMINVAEEVKKKIQMNMLTSFIKADTEYIENTFIMITKFNKIINFVQSP